MEEKTILKCISCNKRAKAGCNNVKCYKCCSQNIKKICPLHQEELTRKKVEERYVQEALDKSNSTKKAKRLFHHEESKFTDFNQTVVIWCLKDFCQNKRMSAPTFTQLERMKSSKDLKRKRNQSRGHSAPVVEVDDMTRLRQCKRNNFRRRQSKYMNLKKQWEANVQQQEADNNSTLWLINKVSSMKS